MTVPQVAVLCRGMILEISALQARVAHLEEEKRSLEQKLSLKFKERYDPLVRQLFSTCIQLKVRNVTSFGFLVTFYFTGPLILHQFPLKLSVKEFAGFKLFIFSTFYRNAMWCKF